MTTKETAIISQEDLEELAKLYAGHEIGEDEAGSVILRIKVGSSGAKHFVDGDGEIYPQIEGVVVGSLVYRRYYGSEYGEGQKGPPDCQSVGGKVGVGYPGGECMVCEFNQFPGDGSAKPCQEQRRLAILTENIGPVLLSLPPTSMRAWDRYVRILLPRLGMEQFGLPKLPYYGAVTRFSPERADGRAGAYTRVIPTFIGLVPIRDALVMVKPARAELTAMLRSPILLAGPNDADTDGAIEPASASGYTV